MTHEQRNYLAQYLYVIDANTNDIIGYLGDLSEHGLMFISQELIPLNVVRDVIIQNNIDAKDEQPLSVKATIKTIWRKPNINPEMFCIGCNLIEIDANERKQLDSLVSVVRFDNNIEIHRTSTPI